MARTSWCRQRRRAGAGVQWCEVTDHQHHPCSQKKYSAFAWLGNPTRDSPNPVLAPEHLPDWLFSFQLINLTSNCVVCLQKGLS